MPLLQDKMLYQVAMTIEEYKAQPFKDATIGDYWYTFSRQVRQEIKRRLKKGKTPDIMDYV